MISIITDSTAYLTRREAQELGVTVLPTMYYSPEKAYEESFVGENGPFEELLERGNLKTSHTNASLFCSAFEEELKKGNEVLCITLSSRLSGTYSSACLAANQLSSPSIAVIDSLTTAGGLFILARYARRLIDEGKPLLEAARELEGMREHVSITFSVDDMAPLRRSGRLGIVRQSVGTILNLRPILLCKNGSVYSQGMARGTGEQIEEIIKTIPKDAEEIFIHYINNHSSAIRLYDKLKEKMYSARISHRKLGPVLGVHLGPGVIGAAWAKKDKP